MSSLYLVMVNPNENNNKYYHMTSNGDSFEVKYGRVGVSGFQTGTYPMSRWDTTYKSKLKKGYIDCSRLVAEVAINATNKEYLDISNSVISDIVMRLQNMAKQAIVDNYTISSSKVTQAMIDEAQITLDKLLSADSIELFNSVLVDLFTIIPRRMGRVRDYLSSDIKDFAEIIQKEQDLLDVMRGQVVIQFVESNIEEVQNNQTILEALGLEFQEVTQEEVALIKRELGSISNKYHQAWKVINIKTQERFDKFITEENIKDIRLLFHGSRSENFWSIINSGLALKPSKVVINGKMFGHGIYFAPKAQKSLGYTSLSGSRWSNGNANSGFMALFNVAYGKPYDVHSFDSKYYKFDYKALQDTCKGANCLHAHQGKMLYNDEIIVYREEQMTIKYLIELR